MQEKPIVKKQHIWATLKGQIILQKADNFLSVTDTVKQQTFQIVLSTCDIDDLSYILDKILESILNIDEQYTYERAATMLSIILFEKNYNDFILAMDIVFSYRSSHNKKFQDTRLYRHAELVLKHYAKHVREEAKNG